MKRYTSLLVCASFLLYFIAPSSYNRTFCIICAIVYALIAISSLRTDFLQKKYLSFNLLFWIGVFFCTFTIPILASEADPILFVLDDKICKTTALVVVASSMYHVGYVITMKTHNRDESNQLSLRTVNYPSLFMNVLSVLITILLLLTVASFVRTTSTEVNDLGMGYWATIMQSCLSLIFILSVISNKDKTKKNLSSFFSNNIIIVTCILIIVLASLYIGDRTTPLYFLLLLGSVYVYYIKPVSLSALASLLLVSALSFYFIGQTRQGDASLRNSGLSGLSQNFNEVISNTDGIADYASDFLPANSALYICYDWKENNGYYYPLKLIVVAASPIPFLPSFLSNLIYNAPASGDLNSDVLSTRVYGQKISDINGGLGTHCVGDIYVSWGFIGVLLFFFLFGLLIARSQSSCISNIYGAIVYFSMIGNAVYIPRASIFGSYRLIAFQIFFLWLLQLFFRMRVFSKPELS